MLASRMFLGSLVAVGLVFAQDIPKDDPWKIQQENIQRKTEGGVPPIVKEPAVVEPPPQGGKKKKVKERVEYTLDGVKMPQPKVVLGENLRKEEKAGESLSQTGQGVGQGSNQVERGVEKVRAVCSFGRDIEVSLRQRIEEVSCLVLNSGWSRQRLVKAEMLLVPNVEQMQLEGRVLRFAGREVRKSLVLSKDTRELNIAQEIDTRLLSNILLGTAQKTGQQTAQMIQQMASQQGRAYVSGGAVVVERSFEENLKSVPKASSYLALANLMAETSKAIGNDRLPPIFKIRRGYEVLVEVEF